MRNEPLNCSGRTIIINSKEKRKQPDRILVTGANGYIASQLIPLLLEKGFMVRCLVRNAASLQSRSWLSLVEVVTGDLNDPESIGPALKGVAQAYYLVHSMASGQDYTDRDIRAAKDFSIIAKTNGVRHIIYLGGLADPNERIANHMRSRIESGEALKSGDVPVTEFRASVIVGPGSISFEMVRYISEQFPLIICPRWMTNLCQPISIKNILDYLLSAVEFSQPESQVFEIGGSEVMPYKETMLRYSRLRGLQRKVLILPFNPVGILAYFMSWLSPVPPTITRPLVEGLMSSSIVKDRSASSAFPLIKIMDFDTSIMESISKDNPSQVEPLWRQDFMKMNMFMHAGFCIHQFQIDLPKKPGIHPDLFENSGKRWRTIQTPQIHQNKLNLYQDWIMVQKFIGWVPGTLFKEYQLKNHKEQLSLVQTLIFKPNGVPGFLWWYLSTFWRSLMKKFISMKMKKLVEPD